MSFKDLVMEWELSNGEKVDISKMTDGYLLNCLESVKDNKESDKYKALHAEAKKRGLVKEDNANGGNNLSISTDVKSVSTDKSDDDATDRPSKRRGLHSKLSDGE